MKTIKILMIGFVILLALGHANAQIKLPPRPPAPPPPPHINLPHLPPPPARPNLRRPGRPPVIGSHRHGVRRGHHYHRRVTSRKHR